MATAALFLGWGQIVRGREARALQVFNETLAYYARLQQAGTIEAFEPVVLAPHGGDLVGFILLRGEGDKLDALQRTEEFQTFVVRAGQIVDNLGIVNAAIGTGVAEGIGRLQAAITELGT